LGIELGNGDRFASEEWRLLADAAPRPASDHAAYWDFRQRRRRPYGAAGK
jgi:hypothetical protein